jgi:prepilin-type N-terminal cleavage/methylation domain-containing protein
VSARRGFTLIELLIGMVLLGLVSTAIYKLLLNNERLYRLQTQRSNLNDAIRSAAMIIPTEVRELDATDGDILAMSTTSITYKATRAAGILCLDPGSVLTVTLYGSSLFGLRSPSSTQDSIILFNEGDPTTRADDAWIHGAVTGVTTGTACAGSSASTAVTIATNAGTNGATTGKMATVQKGAPVKFFEVCKLSLYSDGTDYWLGLATYSRASSSWGSTQPLVGPLTSTGISFSYTDNTNTTTADSSKVARIGIVIRGNTSEAVRGSSGAMAKVVDSLMTSVALRNNKRY